MLRNVFAAEDGIHGKQAREKDERLDPSGSATGSRGRQRQQPPLPLSAAVRTKLLTTDSERRRAERERGDPNRSEGDGRRDANAEPSGGLLYLTSTGGGGSGGYPSGERGDEVAWRRSRGHCAGSSPACRANRAGGAGGCQLAWPPGVGAGGRETEGRGEGEEHCRDKRAGEGEKDVKPGRVWRRPSLSPAPYPPYAPYLLFLFFSPCSCARMWPGWLRKSILGPSMKLEARS